MAVYKVPQDVEADDKLIGPFSFRQFIYLIIVALAGTLAWGLSQVFVPLAIIPVPIILLFGALALPLRKDQPMEIYLAAIVSFYLKPHKRLWDSDGVESLIEITVPKIVDVQLTKDLSQTEAQRRLSYLANIVDSQGWAIRGPGVQAPNSALNNDVYFEAQQTQDVMDNDTLTSQILNQKLTQSDEQRHQEMINLMQGQQANSYFNNTPSAVNLPQTTPETQQPGAEQPLVYNPYPEDMQQAIIQPLNEPKTEPTTSEKPITADIINLASNTDLSIETIAREANRIQKKQALEQEVIISLR